MQITTVVGIVVAVIIILMGLRIFFRKSNDAAPSLDSALHINADSQLPIIPRHVRDQLQQQSPSVDAERIEPQLNQHDEAVALEKDLAAVAAEDLTAPVQNSAESTATAATETVVATETVEVIAAAVPPAEHSTLQATSDVIATEQPHTSVTAQPEFSLNPNIEAAEIKDFDEESCILDKHLHEQQRCDDESSLSTAETIISLTVYPNPRKALSGDKTLKTLLKYGLRFGELSCFHRYEDCDEISPLMFSVLRITDEGPNGFDLETLSGEQVQGLAFFLALPHSNVQKGFDTMVSIAGLIAREIDGTIFDENNLEFTPQLKEQWRHKAIDFRAGQEV